MQRVHIFLEDDIDGGEAAETIPFALDGTDYEVDLNEKNASALREALKPFVTAGRKTGRPGRRPNFTANAAGPSAKEIRTWAAEQGIAVPKTGRIPAEVKTAFAAVH